MTINILAPQNLPIEYKNNSGKITTSVQENVHRHLSPVELMQEFRFIAITQENQDIGIISSTLEKDPKKKSGIPYIEIKQQLQNKSGFDLWELNRNNNLICMIAVRNPIVNHLVGPLRLSHIYESTAHQSTTDHSTFKVVPFWNFTLDAAPQNPEIYRQITVVARLLDRNTPHQRYGLLIELYNVPPEIIALHRKHICPEPSDQIH